MTSSVMDASEDHPKRLKLAIENNWTNRSHFQSNFQLSDKPTNGHSCIHEHAPANYTQECGYYGIV